MSFVSWLAVICTAMQLVFITAKFTGSEGKEQVPDWTKKLNSQFIAPVRGQRSPASVSRFKSGPAPGAWYYIMGHGRDSKRSTIGGSATPIDRLDNAVDRMAAVFPEDEGQGRRTQSSNARNQLSPSQKQLKAGFDNRAPLFPIGTGFNDVTPEIASERKIPGLEEISGQAMLNEFINFLAMKERNLLTNCNTDGRRN